MRPRTGETDGHWLRILADALVGHALLHETRFCPDDPCDFVRAATTYAKGTHMNSTRLYIAGPMTGLPEFNIPAFNDAEGALLALGFETRNPARHGAGEDGMEWADYMRRDIPDLLDCSAVALLPDWQKSRGATLEVHIAETLGMAVAPLGDWLAGKAAA